MEPDSNLVARIQGIALDDIRPRVGAFADEEARQAILRAWRNLYGDTPFPHPPAPPSNAPDPEVERHNDLQRTLAIEALAAHRRQSEAVSQAIAAEAASKEEASPELLAQVEPGLVADLLMACSVLVSVQHGNKVDAERVAWALQVLKKVVEESGAEEEEPDEEDEKRSRLQKTIDRHTRINNQINRAAFAVSTTPGLWQLPQPGRQRVQRMVIQNPSNAAISVRLSNSPGILEAEADRRKRRNEKKLRQKKKEAGKS